MEAALPLAYGYGLVLFRTAALCSVAPALGAKMVPVRVRLALAIALALAAYSSLGFLPIAVPESILTLAGAAARETALGLCAGLAARWMLEAALAAGQIAGNSMGLGYGALLDPQSGAESTALADIFAAAALGCAVALGIHREALLWLCRSLRELPPGADVAIRDLFVRTIADGLRGLALATRVAFPFLVAVTFGHAALGLLGRTSPQLNLASVGFTVAILAGGGALYLVAPAAAEVAARAAVYALSSR